MSTFPEIEGKQRKGNKLCHHIWKLCQLLKSCRADMAPAEAAARCPTPGPKSTDATAHGQALPPSHRAAISPGEETVPTGPPGRTMLARKRFPRVGLAPFSNQSTCAAWPSCRLAESAVDTCQHHCMCCLERHSGVQRPGSSMWHHEDTVAIAH